MPRVPTRRKYDDPGIDVPLARTDWRPAMMRRFLSKNVPAGKSGPMAIRGKISLS
jgi:hypothetical protein